MDNNKVRLISLRTSQEYSFFENVNIVSELNSIARSFTIGITAFLPGNSELTKVFEVGEPIQLFVGDDLVLSGYIDSTPISYDSKRINATIKGRSKTSDLVDCNPLPEGEVIYSSKEWLKFVKTQKKDEQKYIEYQPLPKTARAFTNETLGKIVATLVGAYGIKLKASQEDLITSKLAKKTKINVDTSKTVHEILKDIVLAEDLLIADDPLGDLLILSKGEIKTDVTLTLGEDILTGTAPFDGFNLFSEYKVISEQKGKTGNSGTKCQTSGNYVNKDVLRRRYKIIKDNNSSTNEKCTNAAKSECEYREAQYKKITYTVQGWRDANGELWRVNSIVNINDFALDIVDESFLIQKVVFNLNNNGGMVTTLEVIPPEGIRFEPKKGPQKNTKTQSGFSSLKLEKNKYKV